MREEELRPNQSRIRLITGECLSTFRGGEKSQIVKNELEGHVSLKRWHRM